MHFFYYNKKYNILKFTFKLKLKLKIKKLRNKKKNKKNGKLKRNGFIFFFIIK